MPNYSYRGRDKNGHMRSGERQANSIDSLGEDLFKEGITPLEIKEVKTKTNISDTFNTLFQNKSAHLEDLAIFSRQMQLLHQAGVPIVTALRQIGSFTRMERMSDAINGCVEYIEKGEKLSSAMAHFPNTFSKLMISIVQIGESTGKLGEAFDQLHEYLSFESKNIRQIKGAFRYPMFVFGAIFVAILTLNIFVIPTFAHFYTNMEVELPWQTELLIASSNLFIYYGIYMLIGIVVFAVVFYRAINTPQGAITWGKFLLKIPLFGKLLRRLILIRLSQSIAIILNAGLSVTQALTLVKDLMTNAYVKAQIQSSQELIERGTVFTKALEEIDLFTSLELQIISVGEKNGELGTAMKYISSFHGSEVEFDLKRLNDWIGPVLVAVISVLILIVAMGIYLPIWNMINLVK